MYTVVGNILASDGRASVVSMYKSGQIVNLASHLTAVTWQSQVVAKKTTL